MCSPVSSFRPRLTYHIAEGRQRDTEIVCFDKDVEVLQRHFGLPFDKVEDQVSGVCQDRGRSSCSVSKFVADPRISSCFVDTPYPSGSECH